MLMTRRIFSVTLGLVVLSTFLTAADDKGKGKGKSNSKGKDGDGRDDVVGAIWHYKVSHDGKVETGTFRVHRLEIFQGKEKIGSVKVKDEDESSFHITRWPELNGDATFQKVKGQPGAAKGTLVRPNGQKWDLELDIKDR
jgi:hypothetical protein